MMILDVVEEQIACIEILDNEDCRRRLIAALPETRVERQRRESTQSA